MRRSNLKLLLFHKSNNKKYGEINLKKLHGVENNQKFQENLHKKKGKGSVQEKVGRTTVITHD